MDPLQHFPDHHCVENIDHPSHAKPGIHLYPDKLHVLTMVEDPLRWRSRYWNYHAFERQCEAAGVILYTAEVSFGGRCFEITHHDHPRHLRLRSDCEIWHKEDALNALMGILPPDANYIACVDSDIIFTRSDWAQETLHLLQHYEAIQMFSHLIDLGPNCEPYRPSPAQGFVYLREKHGKPKKKNCDYDYSSRAAWGCPGGAWAYRRSALDKLGRLIDWLILGSGDTYMARALYGEIDELLRNDYHPVFAEFARAWQDGALRLNRNLSYLPGLVCHHWHGSKQKRGYESRPDTIARTKFNPLVDIKRDVQGLYELTGTNLELRDSLRGIARLRNEDSTEAA